MEILKKADSNITEMKIRVSYSDTDQMGMVYYANYLVYFERARTEWLRERNLTYRQLERNNVYLPVIECLCNYHSPARYDDLLNVKTNLTKLGRASIEFSYEIFNESNKLIATGKTKHPFVNKELKPIRIPQELNIFVDKSVV